VTEVAGQEEEESIDFDEVMNFMIDTYEERGSLPTREEIKNKFNFTNDRISEWYSRHDDFFEYQKGVGYKPTDEFLKNVRSGNEQSA